MTPNYQTFSFSRFIAVLPTQCGNELNSFDKQERILAYSFFEIIARHIMIAPLLLLLSFMLVRLSMFGWNQIERAKNSTTEIVAITTEVTVKLPTATIAVSPTTPPTTTPKPQPSNTPVPAPTSRPTSIPQPTSTPTVTPPLFFDGWTTNEEHAFFRKLDGQEVLEVRANSKWEMPFAVRSKNATISPGETVHFRFQLATNNHEGRFALGESNFKFGDRNGFIGLIFYRGMIYPDYNLGTRDIGLNLYAIVQQPGIWYQAEIRVDYTGKIRWRLWSEQEGSGLILLIDCPLDSPISNNFFKSRNYEFFLHAGAADGTGSSILYISEYREE